MLTVDVEEVVDRAVGETEDDFRRELLVGGVGEEIGEEGTGVPIDVAVGTLLVAPGVSPEGAGADRDHRGRGDGRFVASGLHNECAVIASSETTETVIVCSVVVDAGFEVREVGADEIEFEVEAGAGAAGGAEFDLAAPRARPALEQPIRPETEPGQTREVGDRVLPGEVAGGRDGVDGRERRRERFARERNRIE